MKNSENFRPFLSVSYIIISLFLIAFVHMEERRMSYQLFYLSQENQKLEIEKRIKEIELLKASRPSHILNYAKNKLSLQNPSMDQVIHLALPSVEKEAVGSAE